MLRFSRRRSAVLPTVNNIAEGPALLIDCDGGPLLNDG